LIEEAMEKLNDVIKGIRDIDRDMLDAAREYTAHRKQNTPKRLLFLENIIIPSCKMSSAINRHLNNYNLCG